jgi:diaminohydroxyphosphoribosylaminopyrimidine deaminase/5-amino-6-(5-phosphoribosylamino)uracil reductase
VEGGAHVAAGLIRRGLVDRLVWFRAPSVIGGDGLPAVAGFGVEDLAGAAEFASIASEAVGDDMVESYRRVT